MVNIRNFGITYLLIFYNYRFAKANHLSTLVTIKFTENKRLWNAGLRQLSLWKAGGLEKLEARPQDSVQILAIHQYG